MDRAPLMGGRAPAPMVSRAMILAAAAALACVACLAVAFRGVSPTALYLPDGVYPEKDLPFTKALEAHYSVAKKVGDVTARGTLEDYYSAENLKEAKEHVENLKRAGKPGTELNNYFDSLAQKYHAEYLQNKALRRAAHPGQLSMSKARAGTMQKDEAVIAEKIAEGKGTETVKPVKAEPAFLDYDHVDPAEWGVADDKLPRAAHSPRGAPLDTDKYAPDESPSFIEQHNAAVAAKAKALEEQRAARTAAAEAAKAQSRADAAARRAGEHADAHPAKQPVEADAAATIAKAHAAKAWAKKADAAAARAAKESARAVTTARRAAWKAAHQHKPALQTKAAAGAQKVKVDFYFESMCPGCPPPSLPY